METVSKSNQRSDVLRAEGNQLYTQRSFYDALLKYNESLCLADPDSENMGLAYANRSAVYFEMKLYAKCLENIEKAKRNHYPEKNFEILKNRREKCAEFMKQQKDEMKSSSDTWKFFKLSYPPNKKLPNVADCLELKTDKKYGRYIIANRSLKVGDVVAFEEPFCKIVQEKFVYSRCAGCFKSDSLDLHPCDKCDKAMFCQQCHGSLSKSLHRFECPLTKVIFYSGFTSSVQMAFKTFFTALSLFDASIEQLEKFFSENNEPRTVFDCTDSSDKRQKMLAVHSLISSEKIEVKQDIFEDMFQLTPELRSMWSTNGQFIKKFLTKQKQIGTMNYHEIYEWPLKKGGLPDDELDEFKGSLAYKRGAIATGNGSYPFISLINHSCSPNVCRFYSDARAVLVVTRPVDKGEQIFDNYGYSFTYVPKDFRQSELLTQYRFKCNCQACDNDWPLLPSLKIIDKSSFSKAKKITRELRLTGVNQKKAVEKFKELCECVQRSIKQNYPSIEMCSLIESCISYCEMITKPLVQFS